MPQNINLNVSPYYDDFDSNKNYHKVLFKPGFNVQARELTTLQSILQNQIERFGQNIFKDGSMVIPGNIGYDFNYTCVEIDSIHLGIPVSNYIKSLAGVTVKGEVSNILARIETVIDDNESERSNNTLYVKYLSSNQSNFSSGTFVDGENLIIQETIQYSSGVLNQGNSICTTISNNSTSVGSSVKLSSGIYFIRGFFVNVPDQSIILDQYTNTPSYRVGLFIKETFAVASNEYSDLLDNSQGFYNFAAPGADRLVVEAELIKKPLDDFDDQNFIQLLKVENGEVDSIIQRTEYSQIIDEFARRTYDESGDYYVAPFQLDVKESLNNYIGNNGIYTKGQITKNGNTPATSLGCLVISPGKAYVRGYEVEKISNTIIDYEKPRELQTATNEVIQFNYGTQFEVNNVYGYIPVGVGSDSYVKLYNRRTNTVGVSTGKLIGVARLYDLKLKSSSYTNASSVFDASLYDIQTYTSLSISSGFSQAYNKSAYIEGKNSGANGYLVSGITTTTTQFDLYQVSGNFIENEILIVNGIESNRIVNSVTDYSINDVFQITSYKNSPITFTADPILSRKVNLANNGASFTISGAGAGTISTITTSNDNFYLNVKVGDVVSYTKSGDLLPTYNAVKSVNASTSIVTIEALSNVPGVGVGSLPTNSITVNDLNKVTLDVKGNNTKLYSKLNHNIVSSLNLSNSNIYLRKTIGPISIGNSSAFEVSVFEGSLDSILVPFDEEAYTLSYSDGTVESLTAQKLVPNFDLNNSPAQGRISLRNLSSSSTSGSSYLTVTYQKLNCKTRKKTYNRCSTLTIGSTKVGINTTTTGLSFSNVYGRRVEDEIISLNIPEVYSILGVFESSNQSDPTLPYFTVNTINGNINNLIKGERIIGETSNSVASLVYTNLSTRVSFCYLNSKSFSLGETVRFEESGITATIGSLQVGDKNITDRYVLDNGARDSYFDFSRLIRKSNVEAPNNKITIVYNNYSIDSSDSGTFVGVNSYDLSLYDEIPKGDGYSFSDILDFRPRVLPYNTSSTFSPFDFESRIFNYSISSSNSIVTKDSATVLSYNYYLPRTDKLFLGKDGTFNLVKGVSSLNPKAPDSLEYSLEVATLYSPPYVFDVKDIKIEAASHKRYTMKDISTLDERLTNVENYTFLSSLEADTQGLQIVDPSTNLNRFKSGFFVDNFNNVQNGDVANSQYKASIDLDDNILRPEPYSAFIDLKFNSNTSSNIKKTGNIVTLNYNNAVYIDNPYASRSEKINPFNILDWNGTINLTPHTDSWVSEDNSKLKLNWGEWDNWANGTIKINDSSSKAVDSLFLRERNINVFAECLKPNTEFYGFLDNTNVTRYVTPKLVEVQMLSGSFTVGETVEGTIGNSSIVFRVAKLNHKKGEYNNPSSVYDLNPYTNSPLPSNYSVSSDVVNVDIESLSSSEDSSFYGNIEVNMVLKGNVSGAVAKVQRVRLVTNEGGMFNGSLYIPNPSISSSPRFKVGTKVFALTTNSNNLNVNTTSDSFAESIFIANGTVQDVERNYLNIRNNKVISDVSNNINIDSEFKVSLAQSFYIGEPTGLFITKCSIYFREVDNSNIPVTLQIRTIKNGKPTREIVPFSEVILYPSDISKALLSPTDFVFKSPVYLEGNQEYCLVLNSSSDKYSIWTSRLGETDTRTSLGGSNTVSQIPNVGYLFKSQTTSVLSPSLTESIKFTLHRAEFISQSGIVDFYNPSDLNSYNLSQITRINPESIQAYSRSLIVPLNRNLTQTEVNLLNSGYTLTQSSNSSFSSKVKSVSGSLTAGYSLNIINPGAGYTAGITSYTNVDLVSLTGGGSGAKATIGVGTNKVYYATITTPGIGYSDGDILTIDYSDTSNLGNSVVLTVPSSTGILTAYNSIVLDEVQGSLNISTGNLVMNNVTLTGAYPSDEPTVINDGLHLKVSSKNHGMYAQNNYVRLSGVQSDIPPTKLVANVTTTSSIIYVEDASMFELFEGSAVGAGNTGYIQVNNEIIGYTGVSTSVSPNEITVNTAPTYSRGVDSTIATLHFTNDLVFKYEFNGVSLRRINKQHSLADVDYSKYSIGLDEYYVKIPDASKKYFRKTKSGGTYTPYLASGNWNSPRTTKNIVYNIIRPVINVISPGSSSITSKIRTHSATSVNGTEISFVDKGLEPFSLSSDNTFNSLRGIFSRDNELEYIETAGNNSLSLQMVLSTSNSKVSPVIDLEKIGLITIMNRINSPILDWETDSRINKLENDPNAAIYLTKKIVLSKPADSLKVMFDAYRHQSNDVRVAYRLFRNDIQDEYQLYELFPGYGNIDSLGNTINSSNNSGLPDVLTTPSGSSNEFKPYEYNVRSPYIFTGFQIKIIMAGTDQANVPKIRMLRAIASI